jgi:type IV secretion system protein VirB11
MLNADGTLWIERLGTEMECIGTMSPSQAESVICSVAAYHKEIVTRDNPIFEGELPLNGERFEALIPPVVSAPVFTIRLKASKIFTLAEYVSASIMTEHQREMIESAVLNRRNILVVGGTGTGKTTLTNATFALKNKMNIPCRFSLSVC